MVFISTHTVVMAILCAGSAFATRPNGRPTPRDIGIRDLSEIDPRSSYWPDTPAPRGFARRLEGRSTGHGKSKFKKNSKKQWTTTDVQKLEKETAKKEKATCKIVQELLTAEPMEDYEKASNYYELLVRWSFNPEVIEPCFKRLGRNNLSADLRFDKDEMMKIIAPGGFVTRDEARERIFYAAEKIFYANRHRLTEVMKEIGWKEDDTSKW